MAGLGYPTITVNALDGKKYSTDMGGFYEQTLASNGMEVYVKLLNIGSGKLIAISREEAIRCGIESIYTAAEREAARNNAPAKPKQKIDDKYFAEHPEMEEDVRLRERIRRDAVSTTGLGKSHRPSDKPPATPHRKEAAPTIRRSGHTTAEMISEEAKKLSKK